MLIKIIPGLQWITSYKPSYLKGDILAGLTVAVMLVPQAMGYALLAGLPPVTGLYASTVPLLIYALLGSSRHLAVGPVAMISLLVFSVASGLALLGSSHYLSLVILISLISGTGQILLGLFRCGFIVNFISDAVIIGFTSAAALIIGISQAGHLLGISLTGKGFVQISTALVKNIQEAHVGTMGISIVCIVLLITLKKKLPRFPGGILVVVAASVVVYVTHLHEAGVAVIGTVPKGIPRFSVPVLDFKILFQLLPGSAAIIFVGFMESIAIAQSLATRQNYSISANNELIGLGAANIGAAFFSGYPVTGGLSRTAVNYDSGAKTPLASVITAGGIVLTLFFLTPLFYYLPKAVLASIIVVAVSGLVEIKSWCHLFEIRRSDGLIVLITFLATLSTGIEYGILLGIGVSLLLFIWQSAHPGIVELGYVEEENAYLNIHRFPKATILPHTLILRIDGPLFFANTAFIENYIRKVLTIRKETTSIVLNLAGVNDADAVSINRLSKFVREYQRHQIRFALAEMKGVVRDLFIKAKWEECCQQKITYRSIHHTIEDILHTPK